MLFSLWVAVLVASISAPASTARAADGIEGVLPVGADGKPLNLDFETGTLKDWTADGEAFKGQPIKGDTVVTRRGDMQEPASGPILDRRLRSPRRQARKAR